MEVIVTTTGSMPRTLLKEAGEPGLRAAIQAVVQLQLEAGVDLIVDGQFRSDIVGIFARRIGLTGEGLPYLVRASIGKPEHAVTLPDLEVAAEALRASGKGNVPLKAHVTGPTVMVESCLIDAETPVFYQGEAGFQRLALDLATALAEEARQIANRAQDLNIQYLQIDEPSLVYGADLKLAGQAMAVVVDAWKEAGGGPVILHACGDVGAILPELAALPVDILNLESIHLREIENQSIQRVIDSGKQLALGVVPVNSERVPVPEWIARELLYAGDRFGLEHIWGITPNCGMRLSETSLAARRMDNLVKAAGILRAQRGGHVGEVQA